MKGTLSVIVVDPESDLEVAQKDYQHGDSEVRAVSGDVDLEFGFKVMWAVNYFFLMKHIVIYFIYLRLCQANVLEELVIQLSVL